MLADKLFRELYENRVAMRVEPDLDTGEVCAIFRKEGYGDSCVIRFKAPLLLIGESNVSYELLQNLHKYLNILKGNESDDK